MVLSEEHKKRVKEHISKETPGRLLCSVCSGQEWVLSDRVFELPEFQARGLIIGGPRIPVVVVTCKKCGNTLFFNAIHVGVVEPIKKEVKK